MDNQKIADQALTASLVALSAACVYLMIKIIEDLTRDRDYIPSVLDTAERLYRPTSYDRVPEDASKSPNSTGLHVCAGTDTITGDDVQRNNADGQHERRTTGASEQSETQGGKARTTKAPRVKNVVPADVPGVPEETVE